MPLYFSDFNYTPKEILQYESIISMRNDFDFWKNTFQVSFLYFPLTYMYIPIIRLINRLENITNNFPLC